VDLNVLVCTLVAAPLLGFLINGFRFRSENGIIAGVIGTASVITSFVCSVLVWLSLAQRPEAARFLRLHLFKWVEAGDFVANIGFIIDPLSVIMLLVITGVGSLIHLFSIGYMSHDHRPAKYFAYLNLFIFNMLLLVLGDNLLLMFVGWEGVGLCSYLLIGFWFTDQEKAAAGMKAFITNRIGDAGFLLGIFMLFIASGSVDFFELWQWAPSVTESAWLSPVTLACIFLFIGAIGKSAQIPLYVWLPDAMAGPTPVSALIHAATMVTAGVYMIVRLNPVFIVAPNAMLIVAWVGALTAFFAATIALTQNDIKKVLAYSTVSQLGYMFLGAGVGAFGAAMFHLVTHAFFKALMFLGAGSVIHAMAGEQDIRKMGGLKKKMPITHLTFFLGWLAIIGVPPFAGFFSKDEILWLTLQSPLGSKMLWLIGGATAGLTAFYMTRLMLLTFWGKSRVPKEVHPHESPMVMTFPLMILGLLSVIGGWIGVPHVFAELPGIGGLFHHIPNILEHWLDKSLSPIPGIAEASAALEFSAMASTLLVVGASVIAAVLCYSPKNNLSERISLKFSGLHRLLLNKYWVDEFYFSRIINPLIECSRGLWLYIDVNFIDRMTFVAGDIARGAGSFMRGLQNGNVQYYAFYIVAGVVGVIMMCSQW